MKRLKDLIQEAQDFLEMDCVFTENDYPEIDDALKRVKVVRQGKRIIKWKTDKPGFKVVMVNGRPKEVKITPKEKLARAKGQRRGKVKRRSTKAKSAQRRKRSLRLRP